MKKKKKLISKYIYFPHACYRAIHGVPNISTCHIRIHMGRKKYDKKLLSHPHNDLVPAHLYTRTSISTPVHRHMSSARFAHPFRHHTQLFLTSQKPLDLIRIRNWHPYDLFRYQLKVIGQS